MIGFRKGFYPKLKFSASHVNIIDARGASSAKMIWKPF
jgi:hypothetical protein